MSGNRTIRPLANELGSVCRARSCCSATLVVSHRSSCVLALTKTAPKEQHLNTIGGPTHRTCVSRS